MATTKAFELGDLGTELVVNADGEITSLNINADGVTEGTTNLYFTDSRARGAISVSGNLTYDSGTGVLGFTMPTTIASLSNHDTDDLGEGTTNLYFTSARARASLTGGTGITYNSSSGQINLTATSVTAGSYGSASQVPQVTVDAYGRITGITTTNVAGVTSVTYDAGGNEQLTINTADGGSHNASLALGGSLNGPFDEVTLKYLAAAPSTPIQGQFYFDSLNQKLKVYTGSSWVDAVPASVGGGGGSTTDAVATFNKYSYAISSSTNAVSGASSESVNATAIKSGQLYEITTVGTTDFVTDFGASANTLGVTFTASDDGDTNSGTGVASPYLNYIVDGSQNVEVYVNGIKQIEGSSNDYVATTGSSVTFTFNIPAGSVVDIQVYELLTQDSFYLKTNTYTQSEVNSQISTAVGAYVPLAGGTMTGGLDVDSTARVLANNALYFMNTNNSASSYLKNTLGAGAADLRLGVLGDDKVTILSNGNVGIGTTSPVLGSGWNRVIHAHTAGAGSHIRFTDATTGSGGEVGLFIGQYGNDSYIINRQTSGSMRLRNGTNDAIVIDGSTGNVGIGTSSPSTTSSGYNGGSLHVHNAGTGSSIRLTNSTTGTGASAGQLISKWNDSNTYFTNFDDGADTIFTQSNSSGTLVTTLVLDGDGKVGIGTSSPSQILHLSSGTSRVRIQSTAADEASINFDTPSGQTYMGGTGANGEIISSSSAGDFVLSHRTGGKIQLSADGAFADAHLTIIETGNVGIGTTSPDAPLHVDGTGYGSPYGGLRVIGAGTGAGSTNVDEIADFGIGNSGSVSGVWLGGRSDQTTGVIGAKTASGNLAFEVYSGGWQERLRISNNGNVGIGETNPSERLQIGGNIRAGNTGSTTSFHGGGNDRYIGVSSLNGGDAMFIAHSAGYGVGYFGYEPTDDKLIIACDNGGGNNKIDFSLNAGTNANGATDNLTGVWGDPELRISSAAHMVHVRGDTAATGTTGGSKGLSIYTSGGTSCPIYFGAESDSAQKSLYLSGYWMYYRGHMNEGHRFIFSQGAGVAPRSDTYQFKYNSATRPGGSTSWDGFSDARAKENVRDMTGALDTINQLRPVRYDWTNDYADSQNMWNLNKDSDKPYEWYSIKENGYDTERKNDQYGFIAQEFEQVFPKDVKENELQLGDEYLTDFKTVSFDSLVPVLAKAIQEQQEIIEELRARIELLENK